MENRTRGLYDKFIVDRVDGSTGQGGKHANCYHFVLDCDHDPHARAAIKAYADSCRQEYPLLAADLDGLLTRRKFGQTVRAEPTCGE